MADKFKTETFDMVYYYRGITIPIWNDDYGQQKFIRFVDDPIFGTVDISLGSFNTEYIETIEYIVDQKLDLIKAFNMPYLGAQLMWFQNGHYRDIKLSYKQRILKIFLVEDEVLVSDSKIAEIIQISENILKNIIKSK